MANEVKITITGKDGVSQTFVAIGRNADQMANKVEAGSKKSAASMKAWGDAAFAVGATMGTIGLISSRVAADAEASNARLATSFQNAGLAVDDYREQLDALTETSLALGFDDEDAQDSISALVDVTGDAEKAFRDLALAQDIARARNITLEAATRLVIAAETERFASLQRVGIQVDANATKEEVLAQLQGKYAGQADAYSKTSSAAYDRITNSIENNLEAVGGFVNANAGAVIAVSGLATAAGPAVQAFKALSDAAKASSLALGPAGLGLVAVATIAALAMEVFTKDTDSTKVSMDEATQSVHSFNEAIGELGNAGVSTEVTQNAAALAPIYEKLSINVANAQADMDRLSDTVVVDDAQIKAINDAMAAFDSMILTETELNEVQKDTIELLRYQGINAEQVTGRVKELYAAYDAGTLSAADLSWHINWLNDNSASYGLTLEELAGQTKSVTDAYKYQSTEWKASVPVIAAVVNEVDALTGSMDAAAGAAVTAARDTSAYNDALEALAATLNDANPAKVLDRTYGAIVGNTNAMVGSIDTAKKWADALIAPVGVYSELDTMLANDKISKEEYKAAQEAQTQITEDYTRALEASQVIQAMQAPLIAEQADATADYLESLSQLPEQEQLLALAWADQDLSTRATDIADMAANYDQMSDAQKTAFDSLITEAAAADPVLKEMLISMGLISEGADGKITINTDELGGANDAMVDLTDAIEELADVIGLLVIDYSSADSASGVLGVIATQMASLDGSTATVYVNGVQVGFIPGEATGGMAGYANGGMVPVRLAELGPERLQFANGGTAMAMSDGAYLVPDGTYVSTAGSTAGMTSNGGGPMVSVQNLYLTAATPDWHQQMLNNALQQGL